MMKALILFAILAITSANGQGIHSISGSQTEACRSASYRLASEIDKGFRDDGTYASIVKKVKIDGQAYAHIPKDEPTEAAFPNIEWDAPVPLNKWSLNDQTPNVPFPLGFRQNTIRPSQGGVMCLAIPAKYQNHKIEIMVESSAKKNLCISDTRTTQYNHAATGSITSMCEKSGQIVACFSALQNGMGSGGADARGLADEETQPTTNSVNDESTSFAVVIGCSGQSCHESDYKVYYRVRASKITWQTDLSKLATTDSSTGVHAVDPSSENLDMWCMMMEQRSPDLYVSGADATGVAWFNQFKLQYPAGAKTKIYPEGPDMPPLEVDATHPLEMEFTGADGEEDYRGNLMYQYFPSDIWAELWTAEKELERLNQMSACDSGVTDCNTRATDDDERYNPYASSASSVLPSVLAVVAPLVALLF